MNERQRALLAYLHTIHPYLEGSKDREEMVRRIIRCMTEDVGFAANGLLRGLLEHGKSLLDQSAGHMTSVAAKFIGESLEDLLRGRHKR